MFFFSFKVIDIVIKNKSKVFFRTNLWFSSFADPRLFVYFLDNFVSDNLNLQLISKHEWIQIKSI